jgi:hypothetical protein
MSSRHQPTPARLYAHNQSLHPGEAAYVDTRLPPSSRTSGRTGSATARASAITSLRSTTAVSPRSASQLAEAGTARLSMALACFLGSMRATTPRSRLARAGSCRWHRICQVSQVRCLIADHSPPLSSRRDILRASFRRLLVLVT